jgi:hypothetical protein
LTVTLGDILEILQAVICAVILALLVADSMLNKEPDRV